MTELKDQETIWCDYCNEYHVRIGQTIMLATLDVAHIGD
jgi:hypothetical protein